MARAIICDRCGKVFKDNDKYYGVRFGEVVSTNEFGSRGCNNIYGDLCESCMHDLQNFMNNCAVIPREKTDG